MNNTTITIIGNVVDEPRKRVTTAGHSLTNFRVASTSRRYDREKDAFVDNPTMYLNVSTWRALADNVDASVRKGQPVIVTGRLTMREYTVNEQARTAYEIDAVAVGHDLSRGTTDFTRVRNYPGQVVIARDEDGLPADHSDMWHGLEPDVPAERESPDHEPADREPADDEPLSFGPGTAAVEAMATAP